LRTWYGCDNQKAAQGVIRHSTTISIFGVDRIRPGRRNHVEASPETRRGRTDHFNTDRGSQFTGTAFTSALADRGIAISMDGKGAWRDNVFVERLWRSVK
jgi:transposase InsO family protein